MAVMEPLELASDCSRCFGLCCAALPFRAGPDFAFDKRADDPCLRLAPSYGCAVHATLRTDGMTGCTVFECFGAGQRTAQQVYDGVSWRERPETAADMFATFARLRDLHELLALLDDALRHGVLTDDLTGVRARVTELAAGDGAAIQRVDPFALRDEVEPLLQAVSRAVGARDLRGARLVGADLRDTDLGRADLLGADLRYARLDGADLRAVLFLTQPQVNAAQGTATTLLPEGLRTPAHWTAT
jgi:hypothetical protein